MKWNWETLKGDFSLANSWFKDNREEVFCIGLFCDWMRSGYSTTIPRRKNTTLSLVNRCHRTQPYGRTFMVRKSCSVSGGTKRVLFTMSCWNLAIPLQAINIGYNWFIWAVHCEKNGRNKDKDKVILLHDNTRPCVAKIVKKYLETLKWDVLSHPPYCPDIAPSDYWLFRRMQQVTGSLLSQKSKIGSKIRSPPKMSHFFEMEFENCLRDGKK